MWCRDPVICAGSAEWHSGLCCMFAKLQGSIKVLIKCVVADEDPV